MVYLRGAFTEDEAARMRRRVWARLARLGVLEDDESTWATPIVGVSKSIKRDAAFAAVGSPAVVGAIDDLLGADQWDRPPNWGTVVVTFFGVKVFALVILGSHRVPAAGSSTAACRDDPGM